MLTSYNLQVRAEDSRGLDFIVFEQPERTILSGHVEGHRIKEFNSHVHVEIRSAADPSKIEYNFPLPLSNFFQVKDLPKGKHLVQLRSSLPSSTHKFESDVIEVDLEKNSQIHVGPLKYTIDFNHQKQVILYFVYQMYLHFGELLEANILFIVYGDDTDVVRPVCPVSHLP